MKPPIRKQKSTEKGQTGDQNTTFSTKRKKRSKTQDASGQTQNTTEPNSASEVNNGITTDQIKTVVSSLIPVVTQGVVASLKELGMIGGGAQHRQTLANSL